MMMIGQWDKKRQQTNQKKNRPSSWEKAHSLLRFNTCLFNYNLVNFLSPSALSSPVAYYQNKTKNNDTNKNTHLGDGALAFFTATSFGFQFGMRQFFISILPLSYWMAVSVCLRLCFIKFGVYCDGHDETKNVISHLSTQILHNKGVARREQLSLVLLCRSCPFLKKN